MASQKEPHIVFTTVTSVSLAAKPNRPAMNCDRPPNVATNGKKTVGESAVPHHPAIHDAVMNVEPAKPARPNAAGGAMGFRKIVTCGCWARTLSSFSPWVVVRDMVLVDGGWWMVLME